MAAPPATSVGDTSAVLLHFSSAPASLACEDFSRSAKCLSLSCLPAPAPHRPSSSSPPVSESFLPNDIPRPPAPVPVSLRLALVPLPSWEPNIRCPPRSEPRHSPRSIPTLPPPQSVRCNTAEIH